jgi:hypothetical protein
MTAKKKNNQKFFQERIAKINKVLGKLETEVEKIVRRGEQSSKVLRKNFEEIVEKIGASDFYSLASEKTGELGKEVRRLADDVLDKVKNIDFSVANNVIKELRGNFDQFVEKVQASDFVEIAKDKALNTRKRFLTVLSIPSREDIKALNKKVSTLEKKLDTLSKRAA